MERLLTNHHSTTLYHFQTTMALSCILHHSQNHTLQLSSRNSNPFIILWVSPTRSVPTHTARSTRLYLHSQRPRHQAPTTNYRSRRELHHPTHLLPHPRTPQFTLCPLPHFFRPPSRNSTPPLPQLCAPPILFTSPHEPARRCTPHLPAASTHTKLHPR